MDDRRVVNGCKRENGHVPSLDALSSIQNYMFFYTSFLRMALCVTSKKLVVPFHGNNSNENKSIKNA
jgi:hypothetical protein